MSYIRYFMPLACEAKGYEHKSKSPVGRCILEAKERTGKLSLWVQDLKPETLYACYLLFPDEARCAGVMMCPLSVDARGKAEMRITFDAVAINGSVYALAECMAVAVMATRAAEPTAPLCGYRDAAFSWRHGFFDVRKEVSTPYRPDTQKQSTAQVRPEEQKPSVTPHRPEDQKPSVTQHRPEEQKSSATAPQEKVLLPEKITASEYAGEAGHVDEEIVERKDEHQAVLMTGDPTDGTLGEPTGESDIAMGECDAVTRQDEAAQNETMQNETVQNEKLQEETMQNEKLQDETKQNEKLQDETMHVKTIQGEVMQEDVLCELEAVASTGISDIEAENETRDVFNETVDVADEIMPIQSEITEESVVDVMITETATTETVATESLPEFSATDDCANNPQVIAAESLTEMARLFHMSLERMHNHNENETVKGRVLTKTAEQTIAGIFENNIPMYPFRKQNRSVKWVRVAPNDKIPLPYNATALYEDPFVQAAYRQYNHLILGVTTDTGRRMYVLGVPGIFEPEQRPIAIRLGFSQFKCCDDARVVRGEYGYWLMFIN